MKPHIVYLICDADLGYRKGSSKNYLLSYSLDINKARIFRCKCDVGNSIRVNPLKKDEFVFECEIKNWKLIYYGHN